LSLPEFTGGSIVVDSITYYPPPTSAAPHHHTFLRETYTIAYLLLPTARPDAVAEVGGRFASVSTPLVRRFRVGVRLLLEQPAAGHPVSKRPPDRRHTPSRRPDPRLHRPVGLILTGAASTR
jgi:hypothetical protein